MKTTWTVMLATGFVMLGSGCLTPAGAVVDVQPQWYNLHTAKSGTCPGLDWHVVVGVDKSVQGTLSWDEMKHIAKVTGKINPDDTFKVYATEIDGPKHAVITGRVLQTRGVDLTFADTGTGCDGKSFSIPPTVYAGGGY